MCTVSWIRSADGYELFFNRDERRTRQPAEPPVARELRGVAVVAPIDGDHGGTWIAANAHGLTVGLLNRWGEPASRPEEELTSRGWLVEALADAAAPAEIERRVNEADLTRYRPFTLVAVAPAGPALVIEWDARRAQIAHDGDERVPLISSSVRLPEVGEHRRELWIASTRDDADDLDGFHRSHEGGPSALSVCMHREDARTQSYSRVRVDARTVTFRYAPDAPCRAPLQDPVVLERAPSAASA